MRRVAQLRQLVSLTDCAACPLPNTCVADLLNTYIALQVMGWEGEQRQVLILDAHPPGPLDLLWPVAAAGGGPVALAAVQLAQAAGAAQQVQQLQQAGGGRSDGKVHPWAVPLPASGGTAGRLLVRRVEEYKVGARVLLSWPAEN